MYLSPAGAEFVGDKPVKDVLEVAEALHKAQVKWQFIGLGLGVDSTELSSLRDNHAKNDQRLLEMLQLWLDTGKNTTWKEIVRVLKLKSVGHVALAKEIEKKYC